MEYNCEIFQGFRDWLIVNERKTPERASVIKSNLWELEILTKEIELNFDKVGSQDACKILRKHYKGLHSLYDLLGEPATPDHQKVNIQYTEAFLNKVFERLATEKSFKELLNSAGCENRKTKKEDYNTALILYCKFLSEMYGKFSLDELDMKRKRKRESKIPIEERIPAKYFIKGLVRQLLKHKLILGKDSKTIISIMDAFHEFVEETCNDAYRKKNIYRTTSLITMDGDRMVSDWEVVLADKMIITAGDFMINQSDVREVCFDPLSGRLNLSYGENYENSIELPSFASEKGIDNELSVHIMSQPPIPDQVNLIHELREVCYRIKDEMKPHIRVKGKKSEEVNYNDKLSAAMESINHNNLANFTNIAYDLLRRYGNGFHIELAIQ